MLIPLLLTLAHIEAQRSVPPQHIGYNHRSSAIPNGVVRRPLAPTGEDSYEDEWDFTPALPKNHIPEAPQPSVALPVIVKPGPAPFQPSKPGPAPFQSSKPGPAPFQPSKFNIQKQIDLMKLEITTTEATVTTSAKSSKAYEINFCDEYEFPDELLAGYGLERVEHFIWNISCSSNFFQCSGGQTYALKCPSENQAFDRSITNCNYRNAIRACPDFDHVLYCTIKETCTEGEFACCSMPQKCIPLSKRCDGHMDCADGDDENNCPACSRYQFACVKSSRCISAEKRCDSIPDDCGDYSNLDELGCNMNNTCIGKFMCHLSQEGPPCVEWEEHCDGMKNCASGEDELNCRALESKFMVCEDQRQSIPRENWCDGTQHCNDGSDERYC